MSFAWPWMLLLLGVVPVVIRAYRQLLERRAARRAHLAALGLTTVDAGVPAQPRRRRPQLVPSLFLGALILLVLALARPEATVAQPHWEGTVVLAFDVSGSMAATDAAPTRLEAAKAAARSFVEKQPSAIRMAVVAFGGSGVTTQPPTTDRALVRAAIDRLNPQGDTGLGRGIQAALSAISGKPVRLDANGPGGALEASGPDIGYYRSAAVLLLTDGENQADPDPLLVADVASTAGVKVYPVGFGSAAGAVLDIDGFQVATALNEPILRQIADRTDGTYLSGQEPASGIESSVPLSFSISAVHSDVTSMFCLAAGVLMVAGAGMSLARTGRVI